ncbi:MAG: CBS domain-containing protein, partial [Thermocrispum sp.]
MPIDEAATTLTEHGFSALPVVDDDRQLVGIVTETDLTVRQLQGTAAGRGTVLPGPRPGRSVAEVMTTSVIAIQAATDVAELAAAMLNLH